MLNFHHIPLEEMASKVARRDAHVGNLKMDIFSSPLTGLMLGSFRACDYKAARGKLVRVRLTEEERKIKSVKISGDFFLIPEDSLPILEKILEGTVLQEADLRKIIDRFFEATQVQSLGVSGDDLVRALLSAKEERVTTD